MGQKRSAVCPAVSSPCLQMHYGPFYLHGLNFLPAGDRVQHRMWIPGHAVRAATGFTARTGKIPQLPHFRQSLYMFQMELKKPLMYDTVLIELLPCAVCGLISTPPAAFWQLKHVWKLQWMARMGFSLMVKLAMLKVIPCQTHYK